MRVRDSDQISQLLHLRDGGSLPPDLVDLLVETGALIKGHFRLQSGLHSRYFVRVGQLLYRPSDANMVAALLAPRLSEASRGSQRNLVCLSSAGSSLCLSRAVADVISARLAVARVDEFRSPKDELAQGQIRSTDRVILVCDVVATGRSVEPLLTIVRKQGAEPILVATLVAINSSLFVKFLGENSLSGRALLEASWSSQTAAECEQCARGESLLPGFEFS